MSAIAGQTTGPIGLKFFLKFFFTFFQIFFLRATPGPSACIQYNVKTGIHGRDNFFLILTHLTLEKVQSKEMSFCHKL